jgi:hypothetical protein
MARNAIAYDEDFYAWTEHQAQLLRAGEFSQVDARGSPRKSKTWGKASGTNCETGWPC